MFWYLLFTKPRQENTARLNLERQGYECYLPKCRSEKLRRGKIGVTDEPLFPRYLFIRLGQDNSALSWSPIRSTTGVSQLVCFGSNPAKVDDRLIETLRRYEASVLDEPERLFKSGERVEFAAGPFAGIEGVYQMTDRERRVMVLIEFMSKPVIVPTDPGDLRKLLSSQE